MSLLMISKANNKITQDDYTNENNVTDKVENIFDVNFDDELISKIEVNKVNKVNIFDELLHNNQGNIPQVNLNNTISNISNESTMANSINNNSIIIRKKRIFKVTNSLKKFSRKYNKDCIRKKFKGKLFKYYTKKVNKTISKYKHMLKAKKIKMFKLKTVRKSCTSNTTITFNKQLLSLKMRKIYEEYSNLSGLNGFLASINKEEELNKRFFDISFNDAINNYLKSKALLYGVGNEISKYKKKYKVTVKRFVDYYELKKEKMKDIIDNK